MRANKGTVDEHTHRWGGLSTKPVRFINKCLFALLLYKYVKVRATPAELLREHGPQMVAPKNTVVGNTQTPSMDDSDFWQLIDTIPDVSDA